MCAQTPLAWAHYILNALLRPLEQCWGLFWILCSIDWRPEQSEQLEQYSDTHNRTVNIFNEYLFFKLICWDCPHCQIKILFGMVGCLRVLFINFQFWQNCLSGYRDARGQNLHYPMTLVHGLYIILYYHTGHTVKPIVLTKDYPQAETDVTTVGYCTKVTTLYTHKTELKCQWSVVVLCSMVRCLSDSDDICCRLW